MKYSFKYAIALCMLAIFCSGGCAQSKNFTPKLSTSGYVLSGLPSNVVTVHVNDLRPTDSKVDGLSEILRAQVISALSEKPLNKTDITYIISIDIIEHRSFFTFGNWNASTKFRIRLSDSNGKQIGQWDAIGNAQRSNMWGYATAEAVAQDSYDIAIADMMSSLSQVSLIK
jgi:hypothetical protein